MPLPVSATIICTWARARCTLSVICPPAGVWRKALPTRLVKTRSHPFGVYRDVGQRLLDLDGEGDALLGGGVLVGGGDALDQLAGGDGPAVQAQFARVGQGQGMEVVHQVQEELRLAVEDGEALRGRLKHLIMQRFQVAGEHGQRRAEIMGDIGGHLAAQLGGPFQVGAHAVKLGGERPQLVAGAHRHPPPQVARRDARRRPRSTRAAGG